MIIIKWDISPHNSFYGRSMRYDFNWREMTGAVGASAARWQQQQHHHHYHHHLAGTNKMAAAPPPQNGGRRGATRLNAAPIPANKIDRHRWIICSRLIETSADDITGVEMARAAERQGGRAAGRRGGRATLPGTHDTVCKFKLRKRRSCDDRKRWRYTIQQNRRQRFHKTIK